MQRILHYDEGALKLVFKYNTNMNTVPNTDTLASFLTVCIRGLTV